MAFLMGFRGCLALLFGAVIFLGCSAPVEIPFAVQEEIQLGDRNWDWALVYYYSWRDKKDNSNYLQLSRRNMQLAISRYFTLQKTIGHTYPSFYNLDKRRRRGCRFLKEIDRLALKHRLVYDFTHPEGCLRWDAS